MAPGAHRGAVRVVATGAAVQVAGLAVDVWLHARDPGLAATEGLFSLGNAGHTLLLAGLGLVVLGAGAALWPMARTDRRAGGTLAVTSATAVTAAVAVVAAFVATAGDHSHPAEDRAHTPAAHGEHGDHRDHGDSGGHGAHGDHGSFGPVVEVPLDPAEERALARQWAAAQEAAAALPTVEDAAAAGYRQSSAQAPGIGTHWIHWDLIDEGFDPARPSMLLYDRSARGGGRLAGFSYWVRSAVEPEGFAGPNDHWHQHHGLCFVDGWLQREGIADPARCEGEWMQGGDRWMLHAWVVPGVENRWGRFAPRHPDLCPPPTASLPDVLTCSPLEL